MLVLDTNFDILPFLPFVLMAFACAAFVLTTQNILDTTFCGTQTLFLLPSSVKPQLLAAAKLAELQPYFAFHPPTPTHGSRF